MTATHPKRTATRLQEVYSTRTAALTLAAVLGAALADSTFAQAYSEPSDNYLHQIVQQRTAKSSIGSLRAAAFSDDDIEVRIWAGFGLLGSSGGVLSRRNGRWAVSFLELDRYIAGATDEIADREGLLPPCIVEEMEGRCVVETTGDTEGNPLEYSLECARAIQSPRHAEQKELAELWDKLTGLGILELPPTIERDWIVMDGHSYVIQVRVGNRYRAAVIEHADESPVDAQVHQIVIAFDSVLGTALFGGHE